MVGIMRKNEAGIPPQLLETKEKLLSFSPIRFRQDLNHSIICPKEKDTCCFALYDAWMRISEFGVSEASNLPILQ
jgi:hypothetical protein